MRTAEPCQICGTSTHRADRICRVCEPLPVFGTGLFPCCGGLGEHFDACTVGQSIARARAMVARLEAVRPVATGGHS